MANYPVFYLPRIHNIGGKEIVGHSSFLKASATDSHTNALTPGMWLKNDTNGVQPLVSGEDTGDWVCMSIRDAQKRKLPLQYVTAAQLDANDYYLECIPLTTDLIFEICEDGLVTPITDAEANGWADIIVGSIAASEPTSGVVNPYGLVYQSILINSDTADTSAGSLTLKLHGLSPVITQNPYSATASAQPRKFLASIRART